MVVAVIALTAFSFQLFQGQESTKVKLTQLEKRITEVSVNEKDTAKEVARLLSEFDAIAKKQAIEDALNLGAPPTFQLPIGCTPGVDCWIFNYVGADGAPDKNSTIPAAISPMTSIRVLRGKEKIWTANICCCGVSKVL
ncbi:MAG: hypothetical protein VB913_06430, partial [Rhodospirillales bacterium]